jgi:S-formylglutathione hydrolase
MTFSMFIPPVADDTKLPILYVLSGLTCNDRNFTDKVKPAQAIAAKLGIVLAMPDTSPRDGTPGEDDSMVLGTGASFYVNATQEPWKKHYQMFTYVAKEFPEVVETQIVKQFSGVRGVMGHSMGGHGALLLLLKEGPSRFKSCSAFAPASNPSAIEGSPGWNCFKAYLGDSEESREVWKQYDAVELIKAYAGEPVRILVHQGADDDKLPMLASTNLEPAAASNDKVDVTYNLVEGYTHDLACFVGTFVEPHILYHAEHLLGRSCDELKAQLAKWEVGQCI